MQYALLQKQRILFQSPGKENRLTNVSRGFRAILLIEHLLHGITFTRREGGIINKCNKMRKGTCFGSDYDRDFQPRTYRLEAQCFSLSSLRISCSYRPLKISCTYLVALPHIRFSMVHQVLLCHLFKSYLSTNTSKITILPFLFLKEY